MLKLVWGISATIIILVLGSVIAQSTLQTYGKPGVTTPNVTMRLQNIFYKGELPEDVTSRLVSATESILKGAKPFGEMEYSEIVYNVTVLDYESRGGLNLICSARALIRQFQAYETHRIDVTYDLKNGEYTINSWTHDDKYLPPEVQQRARDIALGNEQVDEFLQKYPESKMTITYLSAFEVRQAKETMPSYWDSIPERELLLVSFSSGDKAFATVNGGTATLTAVIDPSDYHILTLWSIDETLPTPPPPQPQPPERPEPPEEQPEVPPEEPKPPSDKDYT